MTKCWAMTDVGRVRRSNEDYVEICSRPSDDRLTVWHGEVCNDDGWALVADGMGGHAYGEIASELAIELIRPAMALLREEQHIIFAVNAVNDGLFDAMTRNSALHGMGTTIAGVILRGTDAFAFNVGDSRIYTFSDQKLTRLSLDHVVDGHVLTQCVGGSARTLLKPYVKKFPLQPSAKILICSDGLTDMLTDDDIAKMLSVRSVNPACALVEAALHRGGVDNVTAVVFEVHL